MKAEFSGIQSFQHITILVGQTGEAAGDVPGVGIVDDGIDGFLQITPAYGKQINTALVKLGKKYQAVAKKSGPLTAPQIEIGKLYSQPL